MITVKDCIESRITDSHDLSDFDCKREKMNEFLLYKAKAYEEELLCYTYILSPKTSPDKIAGYYTLSADSIQVHALPEKEAKKMAKKQLHLPHKKRSLKSFPAVKIGMLAVNKNLVVKGFGADLLALALKSLINDQSLFAFRYVIVDAVNEPGIISFYSENGFDLLFPNEEQEKEFVRLQSVDEETDDTLDTRYMYFDMTRV